MHNTQIRRVLKKECGTITRTPSDYSKKKTPSVIIEHMPYGVFVRHS